MKEFIPFQFLKLGISGTQKLAGFQLKNPFGVKVQLIGVLVDMKPFIVKVSFLVHSDIVQEKNDFVLGFCKKTAKENYFLFLEKSIPSWKKILLIEVFE